MPVITKIEEQKRNPLRGSVHLDGRFAFGCSLNVVAKFALRVGLDLSPQRIEQIKQGELRQECMDDALNILKRRLHSRRELETKLKRKDHVPEIILEVLGDLERLGYVNDERFAKTKALAAADHRHYGRRRAFMELRKSGISTEVAQKALGDVYQERDSSAVARELAMKQAPRLRKLDPMVARRRLVGMLQRRGFSYDEIGPLLDEVLKKADDGTDHA
jgi:regulatory protein